MSNATLTRDAAWTQTDPQPYGDLTGCPDCGNVDGEHDADCLEAEAPSGASCS